MTVNDLIRSVKACITNEHNCTECLFFECDRSFDCQTLLAQAVENKFNDLTQLLDDTVNHHYYDTLESYQKENERLNNKIDQIQKLVEHWSES